MKCNITAEYVSGKYKTVIIVSKAEAIDFFQNFPWELELKNVNSESTDLPAIFIENSIGEKIKIWAARTSEFEIYFENDFQYSDFSIFNNYLNNNTLTVEDVIEMFFDGVLSKRLHLTDKSFEDEVANELIFDFKTRNKFKFIFWSLISFLTPFIAIVFYFFTNWQPGQKLFSLNTFLLIELVLFVFWAPGFYLFYSYWQKNKGNKLIVYPNEKSMVFIDKQQNEVRINKGNIKELKYFRHDTKKGPWGDFEYLKFKLKDDKIIFITCLLADSQEVLSETGFKHKEIKTLFPAL